LGANQIKVGLWRKHDIERTDRCYCFREEFRTLEAYESPR